MKRSYNIKEIKRCCTYSICTYNNKHYKDSLRINGLTNKAKPHDAHALIFNKNNSMYVAFQGSSNLSDIKDVLDVFPKVTQNGLIHRGFYNQYLSIQDQMFHTLLNTSNEIPRDIYFIGHSMGGAIALISAVEASNIFKECDTKIHCYTFGAPVAGCRRYIENAKKRIDDIVSIEIHNDIVPSLPLNPLFSRMDEDITLRLQTGKNSFCILGNHSCLTYLQTLSKLSF